jgi:hypothetical protein
MNGRTERLLETPKKMLNAFKPKLTRQKAGFYFLTGAPAPM